MKFLVLFSACLAAASASTPLVAYPNGAVAPAKTPEVLAAEAAHFAAKHADAGHHMPYATNYHHGYGAHHPGPNHIYGHVPAVAPHHAYPLNQPLVAHPNGAVVPADTPEIAAAKADHFAAQNAAHHAAHYDIQHGAHYEAPHYASHSAAHGAHFPAAHDAAFYAPAHRGLVAYPNGAVVPVEPADVLAARADHLAAHAHSG